MKSTYLVILTLNSILITHIFFKKIVCFKANQFLVTSENTMNSVQCLVLNEVPTRVTSTQFNHHQSHASKLSQ